MLTPKQRALLPWDKSLIIRFAFLDLMAGKEQRSIKWLEDHFDELGDDLKALLRTLKQYLADEDLDVGESDTLRVFWLKFLEATDDPRQIITHGTLKGRDPNDRRSSKWASIDMLLGKRVPITDPHVALTERARQEWEQATERGEMWPARKDENITECVEAWLGLTELRLNNSEKGCLAVALGIITPDEMEALWPKSTNHESNRPLAMKLALENPSWIESDDHRVVMAMAMIGVPRECFSNPDCVSKSFPLFWELIELCS